MNQFQTYLDTIMEFVELQRGDAKARWVRRRNNRWWDNLESLWRNRFPIIIPCHQHLQAGGHRHQLECQGRGAHLRQSHGRDGRQQGHQVKTECCKYCQAQVQVHFQSIQTYSNRKDLGLDLTLYLRVISLGKVKHWFFLCVSSNSKPTH